MVRFTMARFKHEGDDGKKGGDEKKKLSKYISSTTSGEKSEWNLTIFYFTFREAHEIEHKQAHTRKGSIWSGSPWFASTRRGMTGAPKKRAKKRPCQNL